MAIIFEMYIDCGTKAECLTMAAHFNGFETQLLTGKRVTWGAGPLPGSTPALVVAGSGLSRSHVRTLQDALETTESGLRLYHHLQNGPPFRFARVAWEAENISMGELHDYVDEYLPGDKYLRLECAIDEALYREIGSPRNCFPFKKGYRWTRYSGETYKPLHSNDAVALNDCCRSLFPEYFKY